MFIVNIICGWCSTVLGQKEMAKPGDTHTVCPACAEKYFPQQRGRLVGREARS